MADAQPRIILLNDPTRGIDVGTKQEIYQLLRRLADAGAAIIFYSTDYDELIGCCDRVLVLYDGAVKRELAGAGDHRAGVDRAARSTSTGGEARREPAVQHEGVALLARRAARHAVGARASSSSCSRSMSRNHPAGLHRQCRADGRQQGRAAGLRRDGADAGGHHRRHRSVGRHDLHPRPTASPPRSSSASPSRPRSASSRVLLPALPAARINGLIVIFGRLQPIVATIATGAIYFGIALLLRPFPGGR